MIKNLHFLKFLIIGTIFGSYLSANAPVIDGVIEKDESGVLNLLSILKCFSIATTPNAVEM